MSVSLTYITKERVPLETKRLIRHEAGTIERSWAVESISFFDDPLSDDPVAGDTKLFSPDPADCPAAADDARFIVDRLQDWSRRFQLSWTLSMAEVEVGEVSAEQVDEGILAIIAGLLEVGEMLSGNYFDDDLEAE